MERASAAVLVKVGGSLLDLPQLPEQLVQMGAGLAPRVPVFVVGGGASADVVRGWDRVHGLGDERAHHLALEAMRLNERLVANLLPRTRLVRNRVEFDCAMAEERWPLICASCFLKWAEKQLPPHSDATELAAWQQPLPRSWEVTSDAIAAWIALRLGISDLVLMKSVTAPNGLTADQAAEAGMIDGYFPQLAGGLETIGWWCARPQTAELATEHRVERKCVTGQFVKWLRRGEPVDA